VEDARKCISLDRKPGRGLILLRVIDPDNLGKTKLVDLEAAA